MLNMIRKFFVGLPLGVGVKAKLNSDVAISPAAQNLLDDTCGLNDVTTEALFEALKNGNTSTSRLQELILLSRKKFELDEILPHLNIGGILVLAASGISPHLLMPAASGLLLTPDKRLIPILAQILVHYMARHTERFWLHGFLKRRVELPEFGVLRNALIKIALKHFAAPWHVKCGAQSEAVAILGSACDYREVRTALITLLPKVLEREEDLHLVRSLLPYIGEEIRVLKAVAAYLEADGNHKIRIDLSANVEKYGLGSIQSYYYNPIPELQEALCGVPKQTITRHLSDKQVGSLMNR
jgi:hypothetical protein